MKNGTKNKDIFTDSSLYLKAVGWFLILFYWYGCFFAAKRFAEIHFVLPGIQLPVFLGEILLISCLILTIPQWKNFIKTKNKWFFLFLFFLLFVFIKTFVGYAIWGLLAFRHAALFYYSLFFVVGYCLFDKKLVRKFYPFLIVFIFLSLFFSRFISFYYLSTLVLLYCSLVLLVKRAPWRWTLFILLLGVFPYIWLFHAPRTCFVANTVSFFVVLIAIIFFLNIKKMYKVSIFILMIGGWCLLSSYFVDRGSLESLFMKNRVVTDFKTAQERIRERKKKFEQQKIETIKIFTAEECLKRHPDSVKSKASFLGEIVEEEIVPDVPPLEKVPVAQEETPLDFKNSTVQKKENIIVPKKIPDFQNQNEETLISGKTQEKVPVAREETPLDFKNSTVQKKENIIVPKKIPDFQNQNEETLISGKTQEKVLIDYAKKVQKKRTLRQHLGNVVFRLVIWDDVIRELVEEKPLFGFDFGRPFRSRGLEILNWGVSEWSKDGWISMHNSYLDVIYRSGIIGIFYIGAIFYLVLLMLVRFFRSKSITGILLIAIPIYWLVAANFMPILEMPYNAIIFWTILGVTFSCFCDLKDVST